MARRQQLRRDLNSIKMGNAEPLTKYFNRAKTLWQELAATGDTLSESELVWMVLHGLPKDYELMVTVFEAGDARDLSMDATLAKLLPTEAKITPTDEDEGKAFYNNTRGYNARGRGSYSSRGGRGGRGQHNTGRSDSNGSSHSGKECYYCGYKGHFISECRKKQRDERNGVFRDRASSNTTSSSMALASYGKDITTAADVWTLDSGATRHLTPYESILSNVKKLDSKVIITFGNGQSAEAVSTGNVVFTTPAGRTLTMYDVLYIPGMHCNLFSVKCATEKGASFTFTKDKCIVRKEQEFVMEAKPWDGLYSFKAKYRDERAVLS
jgi:hypothetical protein